MKVLVTGGGGFIGRAVITQLLSDRHQILAIDRNISRIPSQPGVLAVALDLGDRDRVQALLKEHLPEAAIHLAWYAHPSDYLTSHENLSSLEMTTRLIHSVLSSGCRKVVVAGSCVEYAPQDRALSEDDPAGPTSLYGACKHAASMVCGALAAKADAELAWARIFHLHGPGEDRRRLIPWVAGELRAGRSVELTDGTQVRDHLHIADIAAGLVALLASGTSGVYNLCSGEPVTLRSVLEIVGEIVGRKDLLNFGARPHRPGEAMFLAGRSARLRDLGWKPRFNLRDGLEDALRAACLTDDAFHDGHLTA